MKTFNEFLAEATIPQEPRSLMSYASTRSNSGLLEEVRFIVVNTVKQINHRDAVTPTDAIIQKSYAKVVEQVAKSFKFTDYKLKAALWKYVEAFWYYELNRVGL